MYPLLLLQSGLDAYILHYTYGIDFDEEGKFTPGKVGAFHFDKRDFTVSGQAALLSLSLVRRRTALCCAAE